MFTATQWAKGMSKACPFSDRDLLPSTCCQTSFDPHIKGKQQNLSAVAWIIPTRSCSDLNSPVLPTDCSQKPCSTRIPVQTRAGDTSSGPTGAQIHCSTKHKGLWAGIAHAEACATALLLLPLETTELPWVHLPVWGYFYLCMQCFCIISNNSEEQSHCLTTACIS